MVPSMRAYRTCGAKRDVTVPATQRAPEVVNSSHDANPPTSTSSSAAEPPTHYSTFLSSALHMSGPSSTCSRQRVLGRQLRLHRETRRRRGSGPSGERQRTPTPAPTFRLKRVGEGIARVDEHRRAPVLVEVVLVLAAGDGEVFAADDVAVARSPRRSRDSRSRASERSPPA